MRSVRRIINLPLVFVRLLALTTLLAVPTAGTYGQDSESPEAAQSRPARVPASVALEISQADEVVITEEGERTTYEYWVNGEMRVIRVIPAVGPDYYLYPEDQTLESGIDQQDPLLVRWKILEF